MQYEITVRSSSAARYDGSVDASVREAFEAMKVSIPSLTPTFEEGGSSVLGGVDANSAAENHYGVEVPDEMSARLTALAVANRVGRGVTFQRFGGDVDMATTPRFSMEPGDLSTALRIPYSR